MKRFPNTFARLVVCVSLAACSDPVATTTFARQDAVNGAGRLEVYNAGVDRAVPDMPCMDDERYRQFDFWVGTWDMNGQRSVVRTLLDGCAVEENYMPPIPPAGPGLPFGPPSVSGRSLNAYDRDNDRWHQTWVAIFPRGALRMVGGLDGDIMKLRMQAGAFVAAFQWELLDDGRVIQSWDFSGRAGSLAYTRIAPFDIGPVAPNGGLCQPQPPVPGGQLNRLIDFFLGEWSVQAEFGPVLGTATIASDLNGCLAREDYVTDKGYRAHSYLYYDPNFGKWFRTFVDSEGERIEMSGSFVNGALILLGLEPGPDERIYQVRNTITPLEPGKVLQTWETSNDGANWTLDMALTFTRR